MNRPSCESEGGGAEDTGRESRAEENNMRVRKSEEARCGRKKSFSPPGSEKILRFPELRGH